MKRYAILLGVMFLLPMLKMEAQEIDSLNITSTYITLGESWYTDYFTGYAVYTDRSFFKDENGGLHAVFLSNYKLYYCYSEDGSTWVTEQIASDHDGDYREAVIYADAEGNPYIAVTVNPYYNYGNPTGVSYGDEFRYNVYYYFKEEGDWIEELVFDSTSDPGWSGNFGCRVNELYKNQDDEMVLIGHRYGWYTYGGELWEFTRNTEGSWSGLSIIHAYSDTPVDHATESSKSFLKASGERYLIYSRPYNSSGIAELVYMSNMEGEWSEPTVLTTDLINYRSWDLSVSPNEEMYLIHYSNNPTPHVNLYTDFGSSVEIPVDLSTINEIQHAKIHITQEGILDLLVYPADPEQMAVLYASEDLGETWSDPINVERSDFPGVLPVTDQYSDQGVDLEFINVSRISTVEPFGPDSLFYHHIEQINTGTLSTPEYERSNDGLTLYPNPFSDVVTVGFIVRKSGELNIRVFNLQGKLVADFNRAGAVGESQIQLDLGDLDSGTYVIEVSETEGGRTHARKIVKL